MDLENSLPPFSFILSLAPFFGFHLVALLFSTICAGNRLLSICTRLLIQELVCSDDGTPFTMLIRVAAARSERETTGKKREEGSEENEGEKSFKAGMEGLSRGSILSCKQEPIMANRTSVVRKRERERSRENPSITHSARWKNGKT